MISYTLFDSPVRNQLLPFTHTRPVADIRCGIMTMRNRWEKILNTTTGTLTVPYLQTLFSDIHSDERIFINAAVFGNLALSEEIKQLQPQTALYQEDLLIAFNAGSREFSFSNIDEVLNYKKAASHQAVESLKNVWDIFALNEMAIAIDYKLLTQNRISEPLPENITVVGTENIFLEKGAKINAGCILNASTGYIYLDENSEILEGSLLRGPIALGKQSIIKMGAKIYGGTTIGDGSKVGGEIQNVVFFSNSNKGHDGYLGNAVIGEWCNLGADTNCSNLKNNYDTVKIWDEYKNTFISTGLGFCGLFMGDHSKCGINTMFNTGTVVGVSCNIYGGDFLPNFIPSFSWGNKKAITYQLNKAIETAQKMMGRRNKNLNPSEIQVFQTIFENTAVQRKQFLKE